MESKGITYSFECPHCGSENVAFDLVGVRPIRLEGKRHLLPEAHRYSEIGKFFTTMWICRKCDGGLGATMQEIATSKNCRPFFTSNDDFQSSKFFPPHIPLI